MSNYSPETQICLNYLEISSVEDSYELGEIGHPKNNVTSHDKRFFPTFDGIRQYLHDRFGVPFDTRWEQDAFQADTFRVSYLGDDDLIPSTDSEFASWKLGKFQLWAVTVTIKISIVTIKFPPKIPDLDLDALHRM